MSSEGDQAGDTTVVLGQAGYEIIDSLHKLSNSNNVREIGGQAVWSVSSCKQGGWRIDHTLNIYTYITAGNFRLWSEFTPRWQSGDVLAVGWNSTSHGECAVQVRNGCLKIFLQLLYKVNCCFFNRQKTDIDCVAIYTDYKSDESYTPSCLSLRVGNHFHDLREIEV